MKRIMILRTCAAGTKGTTVSAADDYAARLLRTGAARMAEPEKKAKRAAEGKHDEPC